MLVVMGWGMYALLVLISIIINPDYQEAKRRSSSALAAVPGDIWLGLGFVLLGMLWGDTIRTEVQPQTGSSIFITVVIFAIVWDVADAGPMPWTRDSGSCPSRPTSGLPSGAARPCSRSCRASSRALSRLSFSPKTIRNSRR